MKILVTGAAGHLGRAVVRYLLGKGYEVRSTDLRIRPGMETELAQEVDLVDLCDFEACQRLVTGMEALVHLGAIPSKGVVPPPVGYRNNTLSAFNIFQAAHVAGLRKIVFASTIQTYGVHADREDRQDAFPAYLPVDQAMPVCPQNWYALSKVAGEQALQYFSHEFGLQTFALRFPALLHISGKTYQKLLESPVHHEGWKFLTVRESARLIEACFLSDVAGFRAYLPAYPTYMLPLPMEEYLARLTEVPLRQVPGEFDSLIDIRHITQETGWHPEPFKTFADLKVD